MSDMETEPLGGLMKPDCLFPDYTQLSTFQSSKRGKAAQGNDKRRKQKEPKKKAVEPPPGETDNDKCRRHKEIQKRIKMRRMVDSPSLSTASKVKRNSQTSLTMTPSLDIKKNMMNSLPRRSTIWVSQL
ncbi:hypothetical protein TNCV_4619611 [Trichonephila clavipes]|nr:hypothetical protein TNCV_4619611 [Trichonephila clavipes]